MGSLLLAINYLAFISLGLPDSLIGAAWPAMRIQLRVSTGYAGVITMIIAANTIVSSLASNRVTTRFGAGKVTVISVLTTAIAMGGFATAPNFWVICLWSVPYGLGAGAVDAALNNYMALHYGSRQMNWMHCFWGVGAVISPNVMSFALTHEWGWRGGYGIIAGLQVGVTLVLVASLPLWLHSRTGHQSHRSERMNVWHLPGIRPRLADLSAVLCTGEHSRHLVGDVSGARSWR